MSANYKALLQSLLSKIFEKSLQKLEQNSKEHLKIIKESTYSANSVSNLCVNITKHLKIPKQKPRPSYSIVHKIPIPLSKSRPKTPTCSLPKCKSCTRLLTTPTPRRDNKLLNSKSNYNLLKKSYKKTPAKIIRSSNNVSNTNKSIQHIQPTSRSSKSSLMRNSKSIKKLTRPSLNNINNISFNSKNNNSNSNCISNSNYIQHFTPTTTECKNNVVLYKNKFNLSKNNNTIHSNKHPNIPQPNNNNSLLKKKNNNVNNNNLLIEKTNDEILSMESNLMSNINLNLEEPLLVSQLDLDYISNDPTFNISDCSKKKSDKFLTNYFEEFAEDHLSLLTQFLNKNDICNLMLLNNSFSHLVKNNFLSNLLNEKKLYESKINLFMKNNNNNNNNLLTNNDEGLNSSKLEMSKATMKAIKLLNDIILNKLFTEEKVPSTDILREYYIYFQLINHPLSKEIWDKEIFWKKCCKYFTIYNNLKIGELLKKNLTQDIVLTNDNIYQVIHLIGNNIKKTGPGYFSKKCSTTGLFAFAIKDVLDFLGLTIDKKVDKIESRTYLTYNKMIIAINERIEYIKKIV